MGGNLGRCVALWGVGQGEGADGVCSASRTSGRRRSSPSRRASSIPRAKSASPPHTLSDTDDGDCGGSTVAVALWALENAPVAPTLALALDGAVEGGVGRVRVDNPVWAPRAGVV